MVNDRQVLGLTSPCSGDGDDDQDDEQPGAVAGSTSDATVRDAKHASVPLRRVRAGEVRWETFLYALKAGPAGGRREQSPGSSACGVAFDSRPAICGGKGSDWSEAEEPGFQGLPARRQPM
jgi:hypothetical protein